MTISRWSTLYLLIVFVLVFAASETKAAADGLDPRTKQTVVEALDEMLKSFDRNDDNCLDQAERETLEKAIVERHGAKWLKPARAVLVEADTNGDDVLVEREWVGYTARTSSRRPELPKRTGTRTVMLPMTDGIRLATDIYLPKGEGPWPVIFMRTPYGRTQEERGRCLLNKRAGPKKQNDVEDRADVLSFTTEPLSEPIEVTGHSELRVFLSSSAVDTDLSVRLTDVYPDGSSYLMAEGMLRVRYRESRTESKLLEPGKVCQVGVELWPTSIVFNRGHRIRVAVTSSNYPRFDINPGTGKPWQSIEGSVKQVNRIICSAQQASHITLPVVAQSDRRSRGPLVP